MFGILPNNLMGSLCLALLCAKSPEDTTSVPLKEFERREETCKSKSLSKESQLPLI